MQIANHRAHILCCQMPPLQGLEIILNCNALIIKYLCYLHPILIPIILISDLQLFRFTVSVNKSQILEDKYYIAALQGRHLSA
jgi:hypothetical protein